jgi:membrane protease YdiL (CAAX protease family)
MQMPVGGYILFSMGLMLCLQMPVGLALHLAGVDFDQIGGPANLDTLPLPVVVGMVVVLAPVLETALCQALPIRFLQFVLRGRAFWPALVTSTLFFALLHLSYSVWYALLIVPAGVILALNYLHFQQRPESAFWVTAAVHAGRNALGVLALQFA